MLKKRLLTLTLAGSLLSVVSTSAQLVISSGNQSSTIDFQSDVGWDGPTSDPTAGDDVFKWKNGTVSGGHRGVMERESWSWGGSDDFGMSSNAWSWGASGLDLGMGSGVRTQFGNYNNDADLTDALGVVAGVNFDSMATFGVSANAGDYAYGIGRNGGNNAPWRSFDLTLRVQNTSGSAISDWTVSLNTWYADTDGANANITLSYSTDNVNFITLDSYTTTNTGGVYTQSDLSGTISASVANGDYLYLQFGNKRVGESGSGAGVIIDNWSVTTAVPEPSVYAALFGLLGLGLVALRRRR